MKQQPTRRGMTKAGLIWRGMGNGLPLWLPLGLFVFWTVMGLAYGTPMANWFPVVVFFSLFYVVMMTVVLLLSMGMLQALRLLRLQEKELGFRFREDASQVPAGPAFAADDRWFIAYYGRVFAFRRDFVQKVDHFKQIRKGRAPLYAVRLTDYQGRAYQLRGFSDQLKKLKQWANARPGEK